MLFLIAGAARGKVACLPSNHEGAPATAFTLHCRGEVRLFASNIDCTPRSKKGRALLAVLAAEGRPLTRVKIIDLLWSDRQEEQARASLRTLLADLKEQFQGRFDQLLAVDRERVALSPGVETDLSGKTRDQGAGELFEGLDHVDPELDEWLRAERGKREGSAPPTAESIVQSSERRWPGTHYLLAALLLVATLAGTLLYLRPWATPSPPVVAVLKFKDLTGKNALLADGLAEELRIHLAHHPTIQVIGRESSESGSLQGENLVDAARLKLHATHVVEGTVLEHDGVAVVSARLVSTKDGHALWTELLRPQGASLLRGARQIAAQVASNINLTLGQGAGSAFEADPTAYSQLFQARQLNGQWDAKSANEARNILSGILARYPRFVPALALMAESTMRASDHPSFGGTIPLARARAEALAFADRAIAGSPNYGPAYLAKGLALKDTGKELPYLQRAAQLSPGTVEIHRQLARALEASGSLDEALQHHLQAVALEPLSMRMAAGLEQALGAAGRRSEIPSLVAEFAARSDNKHDILRLIQIASFDTGDLSRGYVAGTQALRIDQDDWIAANNLMTIDVWLGRRDLALARARRAGMDDSGWTALLIARDIGAVERKMNSMGREFWFTSWAREDASELLVANGRSAALVAAYDQTRRESGGKEPQARFIPGALVSALQDVRGRAEAARVMNGIRADWLELARSYPPGRKALYLAYIAGYDGDREKALELLQSALRDHWTNLDLALVPIDEVSAFRDLHGDPRFQALVRTYKEHLEREKRELETELKQFRSGPIDPKRLLPN